VPQRQSSFHTWLWFAAQIAASASAEVSQREALLHLNTTRKSGRRRLGCEVQFRKTASFLVFGTKSVQKSEDNVAALTRSSVWMRRKIRIRPECFGQKATLRVSIYRLPSGGSDREAVRICAVALGGQENRSVESQRPVVRPENQRIEHSEAVSVRYQAHVLLINRYVSQDVRFDMKALWLGVFNPNPLSQRARPPLKTVVDRHDPLRINPQFALESAEDVLHSMGTAVHQCVLAAVFRCWQPAPWAAPARIVQRKRRAVVTCCWRPHSDVLFGRNQKRRLLRARRQPKPAPPL
jgi:hypothetical protein